MTYSIVARDGATGQLGVAVHSHFLAVGRHVAAARAGVGAVAAQAEVSAAYRTRGLDRMQGGLSAGDALRSCLAEDDKPEARQVAMLDVAGEVAVHTGTDCFHSRAHHTRPGVSAQANMVADPGIPQAMVESYLATEGHFARRLLAALNAAEELGGDLRGRQSAAILIVDADPVAPPEDGAVLDLRVDDDPDPLSRLGRAVGLALAFEAMWDVIRGPACRGEAMPTPAQSDDAMLLLEDTQRVYGAENREPSFWRSVALWRAGRHSDALAALAELSEGAPGWRALFQDVTSRWPMR